MRCSKSVEMYANKAQELKSAIIKQMQQDSNSQPLSWETNTQPFSQTGQIIELYGEYLSV